MLQITARHLGRPGDAAVELATFELLLEQPNVNGSFIAADDGASERAD